MSLDKWKQQASDLVNTVQQKMRPMMERVRSQLPELVNNLKKHGAISVAGLDIGTDTVRLLQLGIHHEKPVITHYASLPLPPNIITKDEIKDATALSTLISQLAIKAGLTASSVAMAVSRSSVMIKNISIDNRLTEAEIESRAWIEANRLFPDLVGNIYLDFNIVTSHDNQNPASEMTLVASRKDLLNPYIDVLQKAGLNLQVIDVNSYALERALPLILDEADLQTTVALLNLNAQTSTLLVHQQGHLVYAHDQSFDGQRLKKAVQTFLSTNNNVDDPAYLNTIKESLSSHLRHTMHFFFSSKPDVTIQKIILAGECANIKQIGSIIQTETNTETIIANPLKHVDIDPSVDASALHEAETALLQCLGLALTKTQGY